MTLHDAELARHNAIRLHARAQRLTAEHALQRLAAQLPPLETRSKEQPMSTETVDVFAHMWSHASAITLTIPTREGTGYLESVYTVGRKIKYTADGRPFYAVVSSVTTEATGDPEDPEAYVITLEADAGAWRDEEADQ